MLFEILEVEMLNDVGEITKKVIIVIILFIIKANKWGDPLHSLHKNQFYVLNCLLSQAVLLF